MTIEELQAKGFKFHVNYHGYTVYFYWADHRIGIVVADVWSAFPDSITALTERARRAAITYLVTQRLST